MTNTTNTRSDLDAHLCFPGNMETRLKEADGDANLVSSATSPGPSG